MKKGVSAFNLSVQQASFAQTLRMRAEVSGYSDTGFGKTPCAFKWEYGGIQEDLKWS